LEADRHREPGGKLAMHLALGRASADRAPRHGVRRVLRRDGIEELAADGHAHAREVEEKVPSLAQPLVDREAAVEPRVVDEALPADGRARLLEVHAHDDADLARVLIRELLEPAPVL